MLINTKFNLPNLQESMTTLLNMNNLPSDYDEEYFQLSINTEYKIHNIIDGVYLTDNLNLEHCLESKYLDSVYGVADNYLQILEYHQELIDSKFSYVCFVTPIYKNKEPEQGGWRWHKWGNYIGEQNITQEYIYDEKDIEIVYVYSFFLIDNKEKSILLKNKDGNYVNVFNSLIELQKELKIYSGTLLMEYINNGSNKDYTFEIF